MTKIEIVTAIMEKTAEYKKTHLIEKPKAELETIYAALGVGETSTDAPIGDGVPELPVETDAETPVAATEATTEDVEPSEKKKHSKKTKVEKLSEKEKLLLSTITKLQGFENVNSIMECKALLREASDIGNVPVKNISACFVSLKNKGYYTAKGKKSGEKKTTFTLTEKGIRYLTDNGLLAAS